MPIQWSKKRKYDQFYALALILKVEGMHRVTDTYGPIIYSKFGTTDKTIGYDFTRSIQFDVQRIGFSS
jgi:hypothetical protein